MDILTAELIRDYEVEGFDEIPAGTVVQVIKLAGNHGGGFFRWEGHTFFARGRDWELTMH